MIDREATFFCITPETPDNEREILDVCEKQGRNYQKQRKIVLENGLYRSIDGRHGWKEITRIADALFIHPNLEQHEAMNKTYAIVEVWVDDEKHTLRFTTKELYDFHRKAAVMDRLDNLGWQCSHRNFFVHYAREITQDFHPRYQLYKV